MRIVYHLGVHCTDEDRLVKGLLKNRGRLAPEGILVPAPGRYRAVLRETIATLRGAEAPEEVQETLLDAMLDEDDGKRVILSHEHFICIPKRVVAEGVLYPMAAMKMRWLANLFPGYECEFALALRNPATLIPAVMAGLPETVRGEFLQGIDPMRLRWAPVLARMAADNPGLALTVWANEDTPFVWPEVLATLAGTDPAGPMLMGGFDILSQIMTDDGMKRFRAYLQENPPADTRHRSRIASAFLAKFARPEEIEIEVALPGWSAGLIEAMTAAYEEDLDEISRMPGITFLAP